MDLPVLCSLMKKGTGGKNQFSVQNNIPAKGLKLYKG